MAGKTVIAIAHRLSTIARMDRLIVLDHGRIVEQGTHDQLLRLNGHYAALWQRQSGGFLSTPATRRRRRSSSAACVPAIVPAASTQFFAWPGINLPLSRSLWKCHT